MKLYLSFQSGPLAGQRYEVSSDITIGRTADNALPVDDPSVSSRHCRIYFLGKHVSIEDLGSTNGTEVNGVRARDTELQTGDVIVIGDIRISVELVAEVPLAVGTETGAATGADSAVAEVHIVPSSSIADHGPAPVSVVQPPGPPHQPHRSRHGTQIMEKTARRHRRSVTFFVRLAAGVLIVLGLIALFRGCREEPSTLSAKAKKTAYRQFGREAVTLTIQEPIGVDRKAEPVTSGVPLPEGCIKDVADLCLLDGQKKAVPCQFTKTCLWPDGSVKWVLLDFQADVETSNTASYTLGTHGKAPVPANPVHISTTGSDLTVETGDLKLGITTNLPGLIHSVVLDGRDIVTQTNPVQVILVTEDGKTYRGSKPNRVFIELAGPMRTTLLVQGHFISDDGTTIFNGKVGYDLRIHAYAGRPQVKLDFTFKNTGGHLNRNEWLYFKSLRLDVPVSAAGGDLSKWQIVSSIGSTNAVRVYDLARNHAVSITQWFKYPAINEIGWQYGDWTNHFARSDEEVGRIAACGMTNREEGFYCTVEEDGKLTSCGEKAEGWAGLDAGGKSVLTVFVRRFWQNFPRGFRTEPGKLSALLWPEDGFWPRTVEMSRRVAYQFEGKRFKTTEMLLWFGDGCHRQQHNQKAFEYPLVARAPLDWYRDTGAVWPLAPPGIRTGDAETDEAIGRYDRLQRAKVHQEEGDPAGPIEIKGGPSFEDVWGKVSIPSLSDQCPDVFYGFMNYGDLVWGFGYCSLFYDWPYGMLIQSLRFNDPAMFDVADDMVRHRCDIDRGEGGLQHYEKGYHGHQDRISKDKYRKRGYRPHASHTWCRGLLLHWVLTGDRRSLEAAEENGRTFFALLDGQKGKEKVDMPEFRTPAWAIEACLAMYEYTGRAEYLAKAEEIFRRTLLAMEKDNGEQGHIIRGGKQSTQFVSYLIAPVARLHRLTAKEDIAAFLKRVLDWHRKEGILFGDKVGDKYRPLKFVLDWQNAEEHPDEAYAVTPVYGFQFADGYAYLYSVFGRKDDLTLVRKLFRDTMFYYGSQDTEVQPAYRTPLGYHFRGEPNNMCAKVHAFSESYGQISLLTEEKLPGGKAKK